MESIEWTAQPQDNGVEVETPGVLNFGGEWGGGGVRSVRVGVYNARP